MADFYSEILIRTDFEGFKKQVRTRVEEFLADFFDAEPDTEVCRVAKYVGLGGGHRWRAMVAIAAGQVFHSDFFRICLPGACGAELAHAASLLLDDLPSMDDALIRRGKPCPHLVFPRWAVDLAPVFLCTSAYLMTARDPLASADRRVAAAIEISRAGMQMVRGQELDVTQHPSENDAERLWHCYRLKSASLYAAAAKAGAMLAGADETDAERMHQSGLDLGLAYQLLDDVADVEGTLETVGKRPGMDAAKQTAVSLWGVEETRRLAQGLVEQALVKLEHYGQEADTLCAIIRHASWAAI